MRLYTTEDRSLSGVDTPNAATRIERQTLQDLEHLTDFTAAEFDNIASMLPGEEIVLHDYIYIKRTHD